MRVWLRWTILAAMGLLLAPASPARAAFGECASADYRAAFDERFRTVEYDCVERLRVPVSTAGGERHIRIVHDFNADWIVSSGEMAEFDRGVRAAAEAIGRLGGVELEDITVLLADDFPPRADADTFSNIAAWAEFDNDGECHIAVFLVGPASLPEHAAWVVAHEIFHCVQAANLTPAQLSTGSVGEGGGGDWWIEGSATWFAALAVPEIGPMHGFIGGFDAASSATPLNDMAYEASVFFLWLGEEVSPPGVMRFLRGMAASRGAAAQRAAMAAALPQADWLRFAQAYLDGEIRHPHGTDLGISPAEGEVWSWSATRTQSVTLEPFVLARGVAAFECGRWRAAARPDSAYRARVEAGGAWGALPASIDTTSGSGGSYRIAALNAAPARVTLAIEGVMESGCGDCAGVREIDACVVGVWRLTGGGAVEWMRRQGVPGDYSTANEIVTFRPDGAYVTEIVRGESHFDTGRGARGDGEIQVQAGGRWSAAGGALNLCADMQTIAGRTIIITRDGQRAVIPVAPAPPADTQSRYACAGATLTTEIPIPGAAPMSSTYTRIAEE